MRRTLRLPAVLLLVGALLGGGCGDEPVAGPAEEGVTEAPPPEPLSRLQQLRIQLATCMAVDGPGAGAKAREVAREILDTCDPDDLQARRLLGWTDFQTDVLGRALAPFEDPIPEAIANRHGYDFLDTVVELNRRRWLRDPAKIERAREAVEAMREHARRLRDDRLYRLGDQRRANFANDPLFRDQGYATRWSPPYLVCEIRGEHLSEFDLRQLTDWRHRQEVRAAFREKSRVLRPLAERNARVLSQLYAEFLRRYGERHALRPLEAPWGGRPDYGPGVRSFEDGVALTVCDFTDQRAFHEFHMRQLGGPRPPAERGYYAADTGRVVTWEPDREPGARERHVRTLLQLGTYQLLDAFTRQRNAWGRVDRGQECFGAGLAGYLAGVRIGADLRLEFTGLNEDLLGEAQAMAAALAQREQAYPLRPLRELMGITSYRELPPPAKEPDGPFFGAVPERAPTGAETALYLQQSWMFVLFLQEADGGRYREGFERYLEAYLLRETAHGMARQVFERCLEIDGEGWKRLDEAFRVFVVDDLLKRALR